MMAMDHIKTAVEKRRFLKTSFSWIILITILFYAPFLFSGEIYRWTDERRTVRYTDDASKIHEEYSEQAERMEIPEEMQKETGRTASPERNSERVKDYLEDLDKRIRRRKEWRKRFLSWKKNSGSQRSA
jgi:hypothetical protein